MSIIPHDYLERCYAGWIGKLIGIRYGAPVEGWTYDKIRLVHGDLDGYVVDYHMFAADDDSNGPMIFIRALRDSGYNKDLPAAEIGKAWLNYAPFEHGFFWWGGYGVSTEHTAYQNLLNDIPAPMSGSSEHNGIVLAEQIGGQIFIDTWGLVCPNQPELAAKLASKAASVSHDKNGIYGGQFIAAAIAEAFQGTDIRGIIEVALQQIPSDCEYTCVVRDVMCYYDHAVDKTDWRSAFAYVKANWGYDRYPGHCHIIPNTAVIILSLLYGNGEFDRTLNICNMCGWDTDCNVGNVATIMGVHCGLDGIDYNKWRKPINDIFAVSSTLGCLNLMEAPWCVSYLADIAYHLASEEKPQELEAILSPDRQLYHFWLPGSTHGFYIPDQKGLESICQNRDHVLRAGVIDLLLGQDFRVAKRTYLGPADMHDNRYDPAFTPLVYPGQHMSVMVHHDKACALTLSAALYVHDRHSDAFFESEKQPLSTSKFIQLQMDIPVHPHMLIDEIGVHVYATGGEYVRHSAPLIEMKNFEITGMPEYDIDFAFETTEQYAKLHSEVSQFTHWKGLWCLEDGKLLGACSDRGEAYTGDIRWTDYELSGEVALRSRGEVALNVRVQGAMRSYAVVLDGSTIRILKNDFGYKTLIECPYPLTVGSRRMIRIHVSGTRINVYDDEHELVSYVDNSNPYLSGCIGCSVHHGGSGSFSWLKVKPL